MRASEASGSSGRNARPRGRAVGYLALFVALGAYAANTIGSADIIDGSIKKVDIGTNAVIGDKVGERDPSAASRPVPPGRTAPSRWSG